jgi:capsular polysaccharide biosynthesis protein
MASTSDVPARDDSAGSSRWTPDLAALVMAAVLALVVAAAAALLVSHRPAQYVATSATLLDQPIAIALSQDAGTVDKLSRLRFKYAGILHSDAVLDRVSRDVNVSHDDLVNGLFTRGDPESLLLFISAENSNKAKAVQTANALSTELAGYIDREQLGAKIAARDRISLKVVAPARKAARILPSRRAQLTAALGAAIATFALVLAIAELQRRRRA